MNRDGRDKPAITLTDEMTPTSVVIPGRRERRTRDPDASTPLLDPGRDFLQDADKFLAVTFADQLIQVAFVPARAARHVGENLFSGRSKVQRVSTAVSVHGRRRLLA